MVSHTFIRREIEAIEALEGTENNLHRLAISANRDELLDSSDIQEFDKTEYLTSFSKLQLANIFMKELLFNLPRLYHAATMAAKLCRRSLNGPAKHFAYLIAASALKKSSLDKNIDHLHVHFGTNPAAIALLCKVLGGPSYSMTIHGPEELDQPLSLSLDTKIHHAEFVIAISDYGRSQLLRWTPKNNWQKIHVVRCGIDESLFEKQIPLNPVNIAKFVCVGRLCEQKGQLLLLDAFAKIVQSYKNAHLDIIGDGPLREIIEQRIEDLNISTNVSLHGWGTQGFIRARLDNCCAMVLTSFAEGLPVVIMEAMARARPVLSTYIAGIPELIKHNCNGWLIPAGSEKEIETALKNILQTETSALAKLGKQASKDVASKHSIDREALKLKRLFDSVRR